MVDGAWAETADAPFCWAGDAVAASAVGACDDVSKCFQPAADFFDAAIGRLDSAAQLPPALAGRKRPRLMQRTRGALAEMEQR